MQRFATESLAAYRQLVDHDAFGDFFRTVTPVNEIERLPMGSRPAKRKASNRIEDLRAIPWVFSWTQCRCLIPAWYGMGAGIRARRRPHDPAAAELLADHVPQWPFFAAAIDNAALALAKSNMRVFREYVRLGATSPARRAGRGDRQASSRARGAPCWRSSAARTARRRALAAALDPGAQRLRRPAQSHPGRAAGPPLAAAQRRRPGASAARLEHLALLTIKGVSAGMRTTG